MKTTEISAKFRESITIKGAQIAELQMINPQSQSTQSLSGLGF